MRMIPVEADTADPTQTRQSVVMTSPARPCEVLCYSVSVVQ